MLLNILAIIPARGGSREIPRKNLKLLNGIPLLEYAIRNALASRYIKDVFLTTDSVEIAEIVQQYGVEVIHRPAELAEDNVTLDPVVFHALLKAEQKRQCIYDVVVTLQTTSPLLEVVTLDHAIENFLYENQDTLISVVNRPRLFWTLCGKKSIPMYTDRKNRQELPPQYLETGAFLITKRNCVKVNTRIGKKVSIYEISERESIDICEKNDWILADSLLKRKRIVFRADGYKRLGMGHIYNCMTMAYEFMFEHDILFVIHEQSVEGIRKLKEAGYPYQVIQSEMDIRKIINVFKPNIWVNDCLNTTEEYIRGLKQQVSRVVTIEDLGSGTNNADAVINALYDEEKCGRNIYNGYKYVWLKEEFQLEKSNEFSSSVRNIIILFGGTDPSDLNKRVYESVLKISDKYQNIKFKFIIGIGYDYKGKGVITQEGRNIYVYSNVPRISKYMRNADLAITSQGRTIYELAAMGVPSIVLSQNKREQTHRFAQMEHGFLNLGIGKEVKTEMIENTVEWLINTVSVRKNMYELMLQCSLRSGVERVKNIILGVGEENG